MTDPYTQEDQSGEKVSVKPLTLTLAFACGALLLALLSMITARHLATLRTEDLATLEKNKSVESETIVEMQTALDNAKNDLKRAKQKHLAAIKKAKEHNRWIAALQKELETAKTELAAAHTTIDMLKNAQQKEPATASGNPVAKSENITPAALPEENQHRQVLEPSEQQPPVTPSSP